MVTGTPLGAVPPVPETLFNGEVEYCTSSWYDFQGMPLLVISPVMLREVMTLPLAGAGSASLATPKFEPPFSQM